MRDNAISPSDCPHCGKRLDLCSSLQYPEAAPKPGDISLCIRCGGMAIFTADLALRNATAQEITELSKDAAASRNVQWQQRAIWECVAQRN